MAEMSEAEAVDKAVSVFPREERLHSVEMKSLADITE